MSLVDCEICSAYMCKRFAHSSMEGTSRVIKRLKTHTHTKTFSLHDMCVCAGYYHDVVVGCFETFHCLLID
jgi:hypothetical protein